MRFYSFRLTAAVSPFMAPNRRHRATITVSLSRLRGGRDIFFSQLIVHTCLLIIPLEGIVCIRLQWAGVVAKGTCEKSLAGSPSGTLSVTSASSQHLLISGKHTLATWRCKSGGEA